MAIFGTKTWKFVRSFSLSSCNRVSPSRSPRERLVTFYLEYAFAVEQFELQMPGEIIKKMIGVGVILIPASENGSES